MYSKYCLNDQRRDTRLTTPNRQSGIVQFTVHLNRNEHWFEDILKIKVVEEKNEHFSNQTITRKHCRSPSSSLRIYLRNKPTRRMQC